MSDLSKEKLQILIDTVESQPEDMKSAFGTANWKELQRVFDQLDSEQLRQLALLYRRMMDYVNYHNTDVLDANLLVDLNAACTLILRDLATR
jgi:hypothetical protein